MTNAKPLPERAAYFHSDMEERRTMNVHGIILPKRPRDHGVRPKSTQKEIILKVNGDFVKINAPLLQQVTNNMHINAIS